MRYGGGAWSRPKQGKAGFGEGSGGGVWIIGQGLERTGRRGVGLAGEGGA